MANPVYDMQHQGFVRLKQILGDPASIPPVPPLIPIAKSTWWAGVKSGRFPKPVKLGPNTTAWKISDIRELLDGFASEN